MEQTPVVREIDGQLVLDDPAALAAIRVISKANCKNIFNAQVERIDYFSKRLDESGKSPLDYVIIIVNVDDANGKEIVDILMPDFDWKSIREKGEVPYARGLASRKFIREALKFFDKEAYEKLCSVTGSTVLVVIVDYDVAEVFEVM